MTDKQPAPKRGGSCGTGQPHIEAAEYAALHVADSNLARCYLAYASSGEVVKLAARLLSLAENEDLSDLDDCEKAADMLLSLSVRAARLTHDLFIQREANACIGRQYQSRDDDLQACRASLKAAEARAARLREAGQAVIAALNGRVHSTPALTALAQLKSAISPTASPPKGQTK